jgi:hypothetical protein
MKWINCFLFLVVFFGCSSNEEARFEVPLTSLDLHETVVALEDEILSRPMVIKHIGSDSLLVYDVTLRKILVLRNDKQNVLEISRHGRGPGEFQYVSAIHFNDDQLHLVDIAQRLIHHYRLSGEYLGSIDTGVNQSLSYPPLPPLPSDIISSLDSGFLCNVTNQPHVLYDGRILLPADRSTGTLYHLIDANGEITAELGEVPDKSSFTLDNNTIREEISIEIIPSILRPNSFVVNDASRTNEIFVVFNAIGEIAKYEVTTGQKLWSKSIPMTNEIDTLTQNYFNSMNELLKLADGVSIHRKYLGGISGPNGELYLSAYNFTDKQLWIHEFSDTGEMVMRYTLNSEVPLLPIFDIDFENQLIFVPTEDSEIRTYAF